MTDATVPTYYVDGISWAAMIRVLRAVGPVVAARHRVEETHGSAAEADAIAVLGEAITDLEEAWNALRTLHEQNLKDG